MKRRLLLITTLFIIMSGAINLSAYDSNKNKIEIAKDLRLLNISWENISGILANIEHESNYNPEVFQKRKGKSCVWPKTIKEGLKQGTKGGCGFGLFQMDGGRRKRMLEYFKSKNISTNNIWEQLTYMVKEYDWRVRTFPKVLNQGPLESGQRFAQNFERCRECHFGEREFYNRGKRAEVIYKELQQIFKFKPKQMTFGWHIGKYGRYWYGNYNYYCKGWHRINNIWYWFYQDGYLYSKVKWDKFKSGRWGYSNGVYGYVTSNNKYIWSKYHKKMINYKFNNNAYWYK